MTNSELRSDIQSIEPIPEADRDSTGLQQMWIWAGANIAPVNWALGALGIVLKLGLWETASCDADAADDGHRRRMGNPLGDLGFGLFALRASQRLFGFGLLV